MRPEKKFPRLFIAVPVSDAIKNKMTSLIEEGRKAGLETSIFSGLGVMPSPARPRILFARVAGNKDGERRGKGGVIAGKEDDLAVTLGQNRVAIDPLIMLHHQLARRIGGATPLLSLSFP